MIELINNYWAVDVPEGATDFGFINDSLVCRLPTSKPGRYYWLHEAEEQMQKIGGEWEIVCTSREATNGKLEVMDDILQHHNYKEWFINFERGMSYFTNRIASLNSLLVSKVCDLNKNWLIIKKG